MVQIQGSGSAEGGDLKVLSVLVPFKDVWLRLRWVLKDGSIGFWVTGSAGQSLEPVSP